MKTVVRILDEVGNCLPENLQGSMFNQAYHKYPAILKHVLPLIKENTRVLDVGTGPGVVPMVLRKMGIQVAGIDTWAEYSETCDNISGTREDILERLNNAGVEVDFCDIAREKIPFQDESFDLIFFMGVIEHLHDSPKEPLEEMRRVLKPGGHLVITTPNGAHLRSRLYLLFGKSVHPDFKCWFNGKSFEDYTGYFGHVREYTQDEIKRILGWLGFEVVRTRFSNCYLIPTPVGKIDGHMHYIKSFKLNSLESLARAVFMLATSIIPSSKYTMIIIGRKR